ncbi:metallophosphoesterase [Pseudoalteromonas sp. R3]|uniref:metallophosphoesterase family protein n=1 Tax=Pseudoalteromonas sp. R3 TaxID=1709477 RepID=UPI0006B550A6|nr:metallophosphoesterase [Pseudoalteromonas sp. R3]AZZ95812.1 hypothetical protein ELR70_00955 [Pseudoalteromonas sp. R3]
MKFLIISDLHASIDDDSYSRLVFKGAESEFARRFLNYVKGLEKNIDYLICPGDIANKGCSESFNIGWSFINEVKEALGIKQLFCVPGNHDLQSRPKSSFSPDHAIKFCSPKFPTADYELNTHFWGWNWVHIEQDEFNVFLINSSAYHGINEEYHHGRFPRDSVKQLSDYINEKVGDKCFNIMLCHHHPLKREDARIQP